MPFSVSDTYLLDGDNAQHLGKSKMTNELYNEIKLASKELYNKIVPYLDNTVKKYDGYRSAKVDSAMQIRGVVSFEVYYEDLKNADGGESSISVECLITKDKEETVLFTVKDYTGTLKRRQYGQFFHKLENPISQAMKRVDDIIQKSVVNA